MTVERICGIIKANKIISPHAVPLDSLPLIKSTDEPTLFGDEVDFSRALLYFSGFHLKQMASNEIVRKSTDIERSEPGLHDSASDPLRVKLIPVQ